MRGRQYVRRQLEDGTYVCTDEFSEFEIVRFFDHHNLKLVEVKLDDGRKRNYFASLVEVIE